MSDDWMLEEFETARRAGRAHLDDEFARLRDQVEASDLPAAARERLLAERARTVERARTLLDHFLTARLIASEAMLERLQGGLPTH